MKTDKFKKGELTQEAFDILMYDLECIVFDTTDADVIQENKYHYDLLTRNIKDIFGVK